MKKFLDMLYSVFTPNKPSSKKTEVSCDSNGITTIVLPCAQKDINHLDSLSRYYEVNYEGLLARGIWLATLLRDSEISDKKLAVVDIDEGSGEIKSVSPITLC